VLDGRAAHPTCAGGLPIQGEYAANGGFGQLTNEIGAVAIELSNRALMVHATSAAPAYFRFAAMLRRMLESIQPRAAA
jgi:hypothetical protein